MLTNPAVILAATTTGGGLWFVVRLVIRYQRDFTDQYARRVRHLEQLNGEREATIRELGNRIANLERELMAAEYERAALRSVVAQHDIPWEPIDWGAMRRASGDS